jgi:radical SAM superfamily enzyme YgiQ (UPF0313 family)
MRVLLAHAPPWRIGVDDAGSASPPSDLDFLSMPVGLLSLHAQAVRAGHDARLANLSGLPWRDVETVVRRSEADVVGLSCFTANRRGVAAVAALVKEAHPGATVVVGGPFATVFPRELLERHAAIDAVAIGEGEATFVELLAALDAGRPARELAGLAWREGTGVALGPPRERIADLDALASPVEHFASPTLVTARGCLGRCSFCASRALWGRRVTAHSVAAVLDMLEKLVRGHGLRTIALKDEVFTARRRRVLALCEGIRRRGLRFLWSCDTRADRVDDEVLRAMRLAGCQMISFGVESGSPAVLRGLRKRISPRRVLDATAAAQRHGLEVRFFMMWGCRGETPEALAQSLELVRRARPASVVFAPLAIAPGTEEHERFVEARGLPRDFYFDGDFLARPRLDPGSAERAALLEALGDRRGLTDGWALTASQLAEALERVPESAAAHLDLAAALCEEARDLDDAERAVDRALALGYPLPSRATNVRACLAAARGDLEAALALLERAAAEGRSLLVAQNLAELRAWLAARGRRLALRPRAAFAIEGLGFEQPIFPGRAPPREPRGGPRMETGVTGPSGRRW